MKRLSSSGAETGFNNSTNHHGGEVIIPPLVVSDSNQLHHQQQHRLHGNHYHHHNNLEMDQKSILEWRERFGFCITCPGSAPIKLYEITTQSKNNHFRSKISIARKHESYQGICLKCHPQLNPDNILPSQQTIQERRSTKRIGGAASRRRDQHQHRVSALLEQQQQQQRHHEQKQIVLEQQQMQLQHNHYLAIRQQQAQQLRHPPKLKPPPSFHHDNRRYILNSKQHQRLMQQPEYASAAHYNQQQILEQQQQLLSPHPTVPQEVMLNVAGDNDSMTSIGLGSINTPAAGGGEYYYQPHQQTKSQYQYQTSPLPYGPFYEYPPPPSLKSCSIANGSINNESVMAEEKVKKKKKKKKKSSRKKKNQKEEVITKKEEVEVFSDPDFPKEKKMDVVVSSKEKNQNEVLSSFPSMHSLTESQEEKMWTTTFDENNEDWEVQEEEEEIDNNKNGKTEESTMDKKPKDSFSVVVSDPSSLNKRAEVSQTQETNTNANHSVSSSGTTATCDKKPIAVEAAVHSTEVPTPNSTTADMAVASTSVLARDHELRDTEIDGSAAAAAAAATLQSEQNIEQQQQEESREQQRQRQYEDQRSLLEDVKAAAVESSRIEIFLDLLVTTLQEQHTSQSIVALCLRHVWDCAKHIDGCKAMIMECRLDVHIKHALEKYLDDEQVQHYGCRCIWSLSVDPICRRSMIQAGAIQWIYNAMEDYKDNKYVLESAFGALRTMSSSYTTAVKASHQQQYSDYSSSQIGTSTSSPARVLLLPLDALRPTVCRIMGLHPSSIPLQRDGCAFLSNVAVDMEQQVVSVVSKDEITAVVQALAMYGAPDVWGCACFCLKNYTYEDRNLRILMKLYDPFLLDLLESIISSVDQRQQLRIVINSSIRRQIQDDANQIRQRLELFKAEEKEIEEMTYSSLVDAVRGMCLDEAIGTILNDILNNPENQLSTKLLCFGISKLQELSSTASARCPDTAGNKNETGDERSKNGENDKTTMAEQNSNFHCVVFNPLVWKAVLTTMEEQPGNAEIQKVGYEAIRFWINDVIADSKQKAMPFDVKHVLDIVDTAANLHGDILMQDALKTMETICLDEFTGAVVSNEDQDGEDHVEANAVASE